MHESDNTFSEEFSITAFYGINHSSEAARRFYTLATEWFEHLGFPANKIGVSGPGYSGKLCTFSSTDKKLRRGNFEGVTGYEIYASSPDGNLWWSDSRASAEYEGTNRGTYALIGTRTSIANLDSSAFSQVVRQMILVLKPAYGIGFTRLKKFGPESYVAGIVQSPPGFIARGDEYEEHIRICRWGDVAMPKKVYLRGLVRDVFQHNYLTDAHLSRLVEGAPLNDWISHSHSGTLSALGEGVHLWVLEPTEIGSVRRVLCESGIIFDWRKQVGD